MQGPRDITIVPQIRLLGPESSYQIERWAKENRIEDLFAYTHVHIRYHLPLQIALMRERMQNVLRRFLPPEPTEGHYSEDVEITGERFNDIGNTTIGAKEKAEWGVYDRSGDFFFFALILDFSMHNGILRDILARSGATAISEMDEDAKQHLIEEFLNRFSLRMVGAMGGPGLGFLSAHDLDDIATICKQLKNEEEDNYVSPDLLNVCTYFCILRFLSLCLEPLALEIGESLTIAALKNDETLQGRYYSNFYWVLHFMGALTRYEAFHMLELWEQGEDNDTTAAGPTTFSSDAGFSISYSWAWTINTTDPLRVQFYMVGGAGAVSVETSDLVSGTALEDDVNLNLENLTNLKDYALISREDITFANRPACRVVWQATVQRSVAAGAPQETQIKAMQIYVLNNDTNKGYRIAYTTTPKNFDKYLPQAQEVIDSFTFT